MNFSLIIPAYNEEVNIKKGSLDKILNFLKTKKFDWEVIIVDDGSFDRTVKLIENNYLKKNQKIKLLKNPHYGKAFSIISGIKIAAGEIVGFSDFDLATPINELDKLFCEIKKGFDIVIGSRNTKREGAPFIRKLMASGFILIRDLLIDLGGIKDTQCGFKIFKKEVALKIIKNLRVFRKSKLLKGPSVSASFDIEFLYLARKMGYKIKEVPVEWHYAETKRVNFLKDSVETLRDIVKIKIFELLNRYKVV